MALDPGSIRLDGRVALVTGAAVGIGEAIALGFARFGADVAVCDRDADALKDAVSRLEETGRGAALYPASDLSGFVTGATLHVDGGNRAAGGWHRRGDGAFEP